MTRVNTTVARSLPENTASGRHEETLSAAAEAIGDHYGARLVSLALFGSLARGTSRGDSDIDLLIVATSLPRGRVARADEFRAIEQQVAAAVPNAPSLSPVFKTPDEIRQGSPLLLDMVEDARVLVDAGGFLAGQLGRLANRLLELGSQRVWRDGWWYWDLKPDYRPGEVFEL
jgi:predicted nucleotidyltransferase